VIKKLKTYYSPLSFKALFFGALALLAFSCSKTTENIGDGLLSESDYIDVCYTDTLQIVCHSELVDTMVTKGLNTVLLGSMMDPVMGRTDASIYTQLHLSSTNQQFGDQAVVDSIVLQLGLTGYYGDTTTLQTVHVYELADTMRLNTAYYQFSEVAAKETDLANSFQFRPHPLTTNHIIGTDTLTQPIIRIRLDDSFGVFLASLNSTAYSSPEAFKRACCGLKICCESVNQDGAICYIAPTSNTITRLILYYRETPSTPAANQMKYYYYITSEDAYFSQYQHDYSLGSTEFNQQVVNGDVALGQDQLYLQSMSGVRIRLNFPNIATWANTLEPNTHMIINEAKLIFPTLATLGDSVVYAAPASLALLNINTDGSTSILQDYYEGSEYYGGSYSSSTKSVTFRIGEHLQKIIQGKQDSTGLYVSISGASYNAYRWVIAGPNADKGLRCEIKYSIVRE